MAPPRGRDELPGRVARHCFVLGIAGLPVWWFLGVASFVPLAMVAPMAWDLWTRKRVLAPPHAGWWLLFLLWTAIGVGTLWAAAPGALDDGGAGRLIVFGYRLAWYVACTVVLIWIGNISTAELPDRLVHRLLAFVFVVAVTGGLLGLLAPDLAIPTVAERILPGGLRSNGFVSTLVSAEAADVQMVLGDANPRPKAPFPYTNTWGSVISLTVVFFVAAMVTGRRRLRWLVAPGLAIAAVPIVLSLNRGLWLALIGSCLGLLVLLAVRRQHAALLALGALIAVGAALFSLTPLADTLSARLDNPHSNDRRSQLLVATVDSMSTGSPVVGFGSTRDVEGTFTSIAGGATPDCPACGVPPLGTQGQLWLVLFSQGWIGTALFLGFFVGSLRTVWRCRTTNQLVATFAVTTYLLQLLVYDTLGLPLMIVMIALALAWRERGDGRPLRGVGRRKLAVVGMLGVIGAGLGAVASIRPGHETASTVTVALTPAPTYVDLGEQVRPWGVDATVGTVALPERTTIDTEAALLSTDATLGRAGARFGLPADQLRGDLRVSAPPLSSALQVTATTPPGLDPATVARAVAEEYLTERQAFLDDRRDDVVADLSARLAALDVRDPAWAETRVYLRSALDHLATNRPAAGEVLRASDPVVVEESRSVPMTSGLALGLLLGIAVVRLRAGHRRQPRQPRQARQARPDGTEYERHATREPQPAEGAS